MQQRERGDRKAERNFINSACDALESGDIEAEVLTEMDPSCYFVSNKKAKHKVPANFSSRNPNQEKIKDGQKHKLSSQITTKKTKRKKKVLIHDSSEEDSDCEKNKEQVPEDVEKEKINENPPHLVFITSMIKSVLDVIQSSQRKKEKDQKIWFTSS